ncbi:MAG: beta-N-acetylhexosaminidase [Lachnospiraceae bacterium]|nr:beta-N-acetylhexosaminidase [Lachnospiraceae bacterium]
MKLNLIPYPSSVEFATGCYAPEKPDDLRIAEIPEIVCGNGEAYKLEIAPDGITVTGGEAGRFYAMKTLEQLRLQFPESFPCLNIVDSPRFAHRGFMLDSARHFLPESDVLTLIDAAASFKLNRMHWHLSDDQGWRVEIKKYPRLAEVGSRRGKAVFADLNEPEESGGYFTQKQIRRIVSFARERHIEIIPEIDMPGHFTAAIAAYPEISCTGESIPVATGGGIFENLLCAGKDENLVFLKDVMDELMELFPYPVVHIGGDEACKYHWRECPYCQARMRALGLKDENVLQQWLTIEMGKYLAEHGRKTMVYNESLRGADLPTNFIVQSWYGDHARIAAFADRGGHVIQSDTRFLYFDYLYGEINLDTILNRDPYPDFLNEEQRKKVDGMECMLWTERIPDLKMAVFRLFPRLPAFAEAAWTADSARDNGSFADRYRGVSADFDRRRLKGAAPEEYWYPSEELKAEERAWRDKIMDIPEMAEARKRDAFLLAEDEKYYGTGY